MKSSQNTKEPQMKSSYHDALAIAAIVALQFGGNSPLIAQSSPTYVGTNITQTVEMLSPDQNLVSTVTTRTNTLGGIQVKTNKYVEVATGMHYLENGQWKKSSDQIDLLPDGSGAIASHGPHKVKFATDIYTDGAIEMTTQDGKSLRSHILGLGYYDTASGDVQIFALVQHSDGLIVGTNQVLYTNAFAGVLADVRYTYRRSGFSQDVILRQQPPSPVEFNMDPLTTRLEVFTEFLNPPVPVKTTNVLAGTDLVDENLDFGKTKMARGKAFPIGSASGRTRGVPTGKSWITIQGRTFLIEEVKYQAVEQELQNLPPQSSSYKGKDSKISRMAKNVRAKSKASATQKLVALRDDASRQKSKGKMLIAAIESKSQGFVLDYETVSYSENFTFQANTTYFVNGGLNLSGTTTIENGAVIKHQFDYYWGVSILISGPLVCNADGDHSAVLTDWQDDTVGEIISGSGGYPSMAYVPLLYAYNNNNYSGGAPWELKNLRIMYGDIGFFADDYNDVIVRNCQFLNIVSYGIQAAYGDVKLYNALFAGCNSAVFSSANLIAQNVTAVDFYSFWAGCSSGNLSGEYNLLTGDGNLGDCTVNGYIGIVPTAGKFASVGGVGNYYYLADPSDRNKTLTSIDSQLLSDIQARTTIAPTTGASPPDNDGYPDLGFHYPLVRDWDGDGWDDTWEFANFGNLNQPPGGDYDGDGVTNYQEYQLGTNPKNADSDGQLHVFTPLKQ